MSPRVRAALAALAFAPALAPGLPWIGAARAAEAGDKPIRYQVQDETMLIEVAIRLYGEPSMWHSIADWNDLEKPYFIWKGRKLKLEETPKLSPAQGDKALLAYWRKHFGLTGEPETPAAAAAANAPARPAPAAPPSELTDASHLKGRIEESGALGGEKMKARDELASGQKLFKNKRYQDALAKFESARTIDPEFLPAWFYEIRTLRLLRRSGQARTVSSELLQRKPALNSLPLFQEAAKESAAHP